MTIEMGITALSVLILALLCAFIHNDYYNYKRTHQPYHIYVNNILISKKADLEKVIHFCEVNHINFDNVSVDVANAIIYITDKTIRIT